MPLFSFFKKKEKSEHFIALLLRDEKISVVIFEENSGKIQTRGYQEKYFDSSIEDASDEEFLNTLDEAISKAEENLKDEETQKTVFGIKENWTEDSSSNESGSKIKKEYLQKLKKASEALGLRPLGFMVIHEAIANLLSEEEGAPVSAILIEADKKNIAVSILRAGRVIDTKRVKIEESIPKTCDKLLHSFECEILPAKVVIFDGQDMDNLQQEFISHAWSKSLSFLHVPQITILPKGFDARAILFGAAKQMGFEVLEEETVKAEIREEQKQVKLEEAEIQEVKKEDKAEEEKKEESEERPLEEENYNIENFGFVKNDIAKPLLKTQPKIEIIHEEEIKEIKEASSSEARGLPNLKSFSASPIKLLKKFNLLSLFKSNKKIIFIPPLIITFLIIILSVYLFTVKATVIISAIPKVVEENQEVTFQTSAPTDILNKNIYSEIIPVSEEGEVSKDVTGKKEVGTKAKGTITIYSRLSQSKTFSEGTIVKANGLEFTLDKPATVASSSGDASASPATADAEVTAKNIGKESNLPSNTKFTVSSFDLSDVVAKNNSAFSGGTKKEITAVAKSDIDKLTSDLPKNLEAKAKESILQMTGTDLALLPVFIDQTIEKKEFNHKIGDEASKLTLKGTVLFKGISYQKSEIEEISKSLIKDEDGFDIAEGIKYEIKNAKVKKDNEIISRLYVKAGLLPKIDNKKLSEEIAGKSFDEARKILMEISQISHVEISQNPPMPFLPKILPRLSKNITITLKAL